MEKKLCICISGGLDSFTAYHYARLVFCPAFKIDFEKEVVLLKINDEDSPYAEKEDDVIQRLYRDAFKAKMVREVRLSGYGTLAQTDSHVVLGRNAMIASIGAAASTLVWICGTAYEDNYGMYDKNNTFFERMSTTLSYACRYIRKDKSTKVCSPFQGWTDNFNYPLWDKPQMILWLEEHGLHTWKDTTSCFHPVKLRCGECAVCAKRFIYEKWVEIKKDVSFFLSPLEKSYYVNPLLNRALWVTFDEMLKAERGFDFSRYHKERIAIYKEVIAYFYSKGLINLELCKTDAINEYFKSLRKE
jgi:7-cyano-7-deazaguanine synthase in queuosine biosynthesis